MAVSKTVASQFLVSSSLELRPHPLPSSVSGIVAEVRCIPDHDVLVLNHLPGQKLVDVLHRQSWHGGKALAVVDLARVIAEHPNVADSVRVGRAVSRAGDDLVVLMAGCVGDAPSPVPRD